MDALDKLFVICAAISIIITAVFGYLVLKAQGWPLAILTALIMLPLLLISGLSTSETLSKPFGTTNRRSTIFTYICTQNAPKGRKDCVIIQNYEI